MRHASTVLSGTMARPRGARQRGESVQTLLAELYPNVVCALHHRNAYELLAATILSAQCTDERVNMVTPALFAEFPTPGDLAAADPDRVETLVKSTGFYRNKTRSLIGMAQAIEQRFDGKVPEALEDLVTVPGVGRKTGNVVRAVVFDLPGLPVDTHVTRLSRRLGLTRETDAVKIEMELNDMVEPQDRGNFSLRLIEHGRQVCDARKPRCHDCTLAAICPSATTFGTVAKSAKLAKQRVATKTTAVTKPAKKSSATQHRRGAL